MMLLKCCTQYVSKFGKPNSDRRTDPIPKKGSTKECSNYEVIALTCPASKIMLKILQVRLQQYLNQERLDL